MTTHRDPPRCRDAVVVVPGILGSELVDPATGELVWGLTPTALARALITGTIYEQLAAERLRPRRLIGFACSFPGLTRFEPYAGLVHRLQDLCTHPDAVLAHPYDWRRPVAETATDLAAAAHDHLDAWRSHPAGSAAARLVFVGHSMGGLLSWHAANLHLAASDVALVLTLGTPFGGSVRAVRAVSHGNLLPHGAHSSKLRACARRIPALHDLLPSHPSMTSQQGCVVPSEADLVSCGANRDLLAASLATRAALGAQLAAAGHRPPLLVPFVGIHQPTLQSFTLADGELRFHEHLDDANWAGDGTVYQGAAYPKGHLATVPLPQQHGALAASSSAFSSVMAALVQATIGPPQGDGLGLAVPDAALTGVPFEIRVTVARRASCSCAPVGGRSLGRIPLTRRTDEFGEVELFGKVTIRQPGLYTVTATGGGDGSVSADVLVFEANDHR